MAEKASQSLAKSAEYDYDLFVIGGGSGGVRCARFSAQYGAKVGIAEERYWGGTCVNVGCVPKKLFTYAAHFTEDVEMAKGYGWYMDKPGFDWPTLRENKDTEINRLNRIYDGLLNGAGCDVFFEHAEVLDPHTVKVGDKQFTAKNILIATGGWPFVPEFPGKEHVITSNEVFHNESFPKSIIIVGGGYIAVEFAGIFAGLGVESHLSYRGPLFLRHFDDDVRTFVHEELLKKDINIHFESVVSAITKAGDGTLDIEFTDGSRLETDLVLVTTGRKPNVHDIGLENVAVDCRENGAIIVDEEFRTSVPNIFALGDVTDRVQLTPVAIAEAMAFSSTQFKGVRKLMDYDGIATAVFCQPNIGTVGLTEEQARDKYGDVEIYRSSFKAMKHTLSGSEERTMMKLIVDKPSDRVVGIHMVGPEAGEIVQGLAVAYKAGATKAVFDATVGIHPTSAEEFVTMREPV